MFDNVLGFNNNFILPNNNILYSNSNGFIENITILNTNLDYDVDFEARFIAGNPNAEFITGYGLNNSVYEEYLLRISGSTVRVRGILNNVSVFGTSGALVQDVWYNIKVEMRSTNTGFSAYLNTVLFASRTNPNNGTNLSSLTLNEKINTNVETRNLVITNVAV